MVLESIERVARILLWLSIAVACGVAPVAYFRVQEAASAVAEKMKDAEHTWADAEKERERERARQRLPLASMGAQLTGLTGNAGHLFFSNVSPREGFVCAIGTAVNDKVGAHVKSLAACKQVSAFETSIEINLLFPGGDIKTWCPGDSCSLDVAEAPAPPG